LFTPIHTTEGKNPNNQLEQNRSKYTITHLAILSIYSITLFTKTQSKSVTKMATGNKDRLQEEAVTHTKVRPEAVAMVPWMIA